MVEAFSERKDRFMKGVPGAASQFNKLKEDLGHQVKLNMGGEGGKDAMYPLKDVLKAVEHEDVVRHAEQLTENI